MEIDIPLPILYRFRKWDKNDRAGFGHRILTQPSVYFVAPKDFNDPFDCNLGIGLEHKSFLEILEWHRDMGNRFKSDVGRIRESLQAYKADPERWTSDRQTKLRESLEKESGVLCLSENCTNILMWSHYANHHRGFCVGIDAGQLMSEYKSRKPANILLDCIKVKYEWPTLEAICIDDTEWAKQQFRYKFIDWAYEQEYRIVMNELKRAELCEADRNVPIDAKAIKEVIFGCQISEIDSTEIKSEIRLLAAVNPAIKLLRAVKSKSAFAIEIVPEPL